MPITRAARAIERKPLDETSHFLLLDTDIDNLENALSAGFDDVRGEFDGLRKQQRDDRDELKKKYDWLIRAAFGVMVSLLTTSLLLFINLYK